MCYLTDGHKYNNQDFDKKYAIIPIMIDQILLISSIKRIEKYDYDTGLIKSFY